MKLLSSLFFVFCLYSCNEDVVRMPKPRGYCRIDLPAKAYQTYNGQCPYSFEFPSYATIEQDSGRFAEKCMQNIVLKPMKGKIYLTYKPILNNMDALFKDSRQLAYKHSVKASRIDEYAIYLPGKKVFGIIYEIGGNAASSLQFHLTDSTEHFLRGSLYFNAVPNEDSLMPVITRAKEDINHLIQTFSWKN